MPFEALAKKGCDKSQSYEWQAIDMIWFAILALAIRNCEECPS